MNVLRVRIALTAPIATPMHSGILFGHLCWAKRLRAGEAALVDWLHELLSAPVLLSDTLPSGWLPRPHLPSGEHPEPSGNDRAAWVAQRQAAKRQRKLPYLRIEDWLSIRDQLDSTRLLQALAKADAYGKTRGHTLAARSAHNRIDRLRGTTPESGGLYFADESWHDSAGAQRDIYVHGLDVDEAMTLFADVGRNGFGRDASLGRGQFRVDAVEPAPARLFDTTGTRRLSLSHGVLSPNMLDACYKLHTHYGRIGGLHAGTSLSPFKCPLLLIQPGATFAPQDDRPFGDWLEDVHPDRPEIGHHAWHLSLPYTPAGGTGA